MLNKHWYEAISYTILEIFAALQVNMDKVKDLRAAEVGDIESMLNANHLEARKP